MRRPCPAACLVAGTAVVWLASDVHFHRRDLELITDVLRRPVPKFCLIVTLLHVLNVLGWADPFRAAARLIPKPIIDALPLVEQP